MILTTNELRDGLMEATLVGRLDIQGSLAVDTAFSKLSHESKSLLVDISQVTFLASLGVRMFVSAAKTLSDNGGHIVLLNPQENVAKVLSTMGIDSIIPVKNDRTEALAIIGA